jgi:hypothetical protein
MAQRQALAATGFPLTLLASEAGIPAMAFDDIAYLGADPDRIEALQDGLGPRGILNVVAGGATIGRPVALDVGRVHYDLTRWAGTTGSRASDGYRRIPADGELRGGDRVAVIGAAGPMGLMHVVRAAAGGWEGLSIAGFDIDEGRLEHLRRLAGPIAAARGVELTVANSRTDPLGDGYTYVALMVPSPPLVDQAVALGAPGCRINIFAGFAAGTRAAVDFDRYLARGSYLLGTSGSVIPDMKAVLRKLETGELDTNISLDAVTGLAGVADALTSVENRSSFGKIVVYPSLHELRLTRISELGERYPSVAAAMENGLWTKAAEQALLRVAGVEEGS